MLNLTPNRDVTKSESGDAVRLGSVLEPQALVAGLDDVAVMRQSIEQRRRHLRVAEHAGPLAEREIGGDDDGRALVEPVDEVEQQVAAGLSER